MIRSRFYELFIGFRYLKARKNQAFISFNTFLSIVIVFVGVFILIVVISVMNGFQSQIKDKILDVNAHIEVTRLTSGNRNKSFGGYRDLAEKIEQVKGVTSAHPFIQGQALMRFRSEINPVMVRGIGTREDIPSHVKKFISQGRERFGRDRGVYIGEEMALMYGIKEGDYLEIIVPRGGLQARTGALPGIGRYPVIGFFKTGYYEFDTRLLIMSLGHAQSLFAIGDQARGIAVRIRDVFSMDLMASKIQSRVGFDFITSTAEEKNQNLFYALRLEKMIMMIILFLVIISAGFTIMGTLVMVVMEKKKAIGILKTMGATPNSIMVIFILEGFLIGVAGTLSGVVLGLVTALNLEAIIKSIETGVNQVLAGIYRVFEMGVFTPVRLVPTHVYYIDSIPTEIHPEFVVFIAIFAVFLATLSAIFPAWQASRMKPVETIRHE
jgi:lipoprotein-releasing system permease protein